MINKIRMIIKAYKITEILFKCINNIITKIDCFIVIKFKNITTSFYLFIGITYNLYFFNFFIEYQIMNFYCFIF